MGKIIAVCNQKGGTGKTTSAINIAAYLSTMSKQVLLIDMDPQANATSGLGVDHYKIKKSIYNIIIDERPISEISIPTAIESLKLIPSCLDLTGAEVELVGMLGREYRLKKALHSFREEYDFIIIDCPPSLGLLTVNALCTAGTVLIPVQCEYYALEGLTRLMGTINLVRDNLNPNLTIEGVILTMADFRTNLSHEIVAEVRRYFSDKTVKVYETVISRNIRLTEAPSFGKPIIFYDKTSTGAEKYEQLTCEIMGVPYGKEKLG